MTNPSWDTFEKERYDMSLGKMMYVFCDRYDDDCELPLRKSDKIAGCHQFLLGPNDTLSKMLSSMDWGTLGGRHYCPTCWTKVRATSKTKKS